MCDGNISNLGGNSVQQKDSEKAYLRGRMLSMFNIPELKVGHRTDLWPAGLCS